MSEKNSQEWTREEIKQLRSVWGNNPNRAVAETLGRSVDSVRKKAARLGLQKTKRYLRSLGR